MEVDKCMFIMIATIQNNDKYCSELKPNKQVQMGILTGM